MAVTMMMRFSGEGREKYDQVIKDLRLNDKHNLPNGLLYHTAGPIGNDWWVVDTWESQAQFDRFFEERLKKSMQKAGITPPQTQTFNVHGTLTSLERSKEAARR